MGRKQDRTGKYIYLYVAGLTFLFLFVFGCATLRDGDSLLHSQRLIAKGDFEGAVEENQKVLSSYVNRPPADEALFNMGLIYAHYGNPNKDYKKAFSFFRRLVKEFPQSPLYEEAKVWTGVLNTIEETKIKMEGQRSAYDSLLHSQRLIAKGDFEGAVEENQKVLSSYVNRPPADEALFNMGLIYAHYGNPHRDYKKSILFFNKLLEGYPRSPLVGQARIWIGVLQVIEKSKQVDIEIEKMKKKVLR
jgi:outer membrane protein assembly factor BamD (BamD/ComL family)